jgi:signal transduction histidine kinase
LISNQGEKNMVNIRLLAWYKTRPRRTQLILGVGLIIVVGIIDFLTGPELSFSIFYVMPIGLAAWVISRRAGIAFSLISAVLWLLADLLGGHTYAHASIPFWNSLVRLAFFLIVTYTLSALRESRAQQEELAAFVVHDLRSPLSNVMTGLGTLRDFTDAGSDPTQQHLMDICLSSSERMLTLINSLLDLARLESGNMPVQSEAANAHELVETALKQVNLWAKQRNVELSTDVTIETVWGDSALTARVLVNLLTNAIKFSPEHACISLSVAPYQDNRAVFRIADQGKGIPKEWANKVFDKFAQVESRKLGIGSGLGLTFCRLAIEAQGGRIWLESDVGKGTTVIFTLPVSHH